MNLAGKREISRASRGPRGWSLRDSRLVPGAASGLLLILSLPKPDLYPLAWIALVPLLYVIASAPGVRAAAIASYSAGVVFFAGTFYWIGETMMIYGGLAAPLAIGVALLFSLVYALHFLVFGLGLYAFVRRFGLAGLFLGPPLWVTIELMRATFFTGFPWMLSGYALVPFSGLLQIVTWTGVFGLSFVATAVNCAIAYGAARRSFRWPAAAAAAVLVFWFLPVMGETPSDEAIRVRLVQTNISIDQSWSPPERNKLMDELGALSTREGSPELIVWPETPAPFYLSEDPHFRARMQAIARDTGAHFVVGHIDTIGEGPSNSAAILAPDGTVVSRYDKIHLVPFGEYVPLKTFLSFAESMTRQVGDFTPGTAYTVSAIGDRRLSTAICYESIFPDLVRQFVKRGAELLVVITNDGWFGESSAPFQHLRMGVVRAVENRRFMARAANTGISAIIDPYGRILDSTPIGARMILDGAARFRSGQTFYTQYGDVFAYANAALAGLAAAVAAMRRRSAG
jgi:apolipoprotein N-acyltransferase